jgi:hypothetical protein
MLAPTSRAAIVEATVALELLCGLPLRWRTERWKSEALVKKPLSTLLQRKRRTHSNETPTDNHREDAMLLTSDTSGVCPAHGASNSEERTDFTLTLEDPFVASDAMRQS